MPQQIEFPWGKSALNVNLPDSWRILGELRPREVKSMEAPDDLCRTALASPFNAERIKDRDLKGKRVVIVTDDHSRPTPVASFIAPVLDELFEAGVSEGDIDILIATGVHRPSRPDEAIKKLGQETASRFKWRCHDAHAPSGLADLGLTSRGTRVFLNRLLTAADLVICLGAIEPHLLLGFGGGLKMLIPGCAGAETIGKNHMQGVDPDHFDFVGAAADESPMRLDLEEGALKLEKEIFIVNAVMDEHAKPTRFFCGHPLETHRQGVAYLEKIAGMDVPEEADVVLTNSYPMENDLRQSVKCVGNTLYACRPGGVMLGCVKCEQGLGEMPLAKKTLPYPFMRGLLQVIGGQRVLPLVEKAKRGEPVEEVFIGHFGLQMLRRNHLALFSDSSKLPENIGRKMGLARSYTSLDEMINWAAGRVPRNAKVWVFPYGGSTYARKPNG